MKYFSSFPDGCQPEKRKDCLVQLVQRFSEQDEPLSLVDLYQIAFLGRARKNAFPCYTFIPSLVACGVASYDMLDDISGLERQNKVKMKSKSDKPFQYEEDRKIMTEKDGVKEEITYEKDVHEGVSAKDIGNIVKRREEELGFPEKVREAHPIIMEAFAKGIEEAFMPIMINIYPNKSEDARPKSKPKSSLKRVFGFLSRKDKQEVYQNCSGLLEELHKDIEPEKEYKTFTRKLQVLIDQIPEEKKPEVIEFEEAMEHDRKERLRIELKSLNLD
jgi:hypothetical protein